MGFCHPWRQVRLAALKLGRVKPADCFAQSACWRRLPVETGVRQHSQGVEQRRTLV
jgi:hypothetical protein